MAESVYVRYPDDHNDSPDNLDAPNPVKKIAARKLDVYRGQGYVQCDENGGPVADVRPLGADAAAAAGKLAGRKDDKEAAKVFTPPDDAKGTAPKPAAASSTSGGGN